MVKNDPQFIKNIAFGNRVADLRRDQNNQDIIGHPRNGGINQQVRFCIAYNIGRVSSSPIFHAVHLRP